MNHMWKQKDYRKAREIINSTGLSKDELMGVIRHVCDEASKRSFRA